MKKKMKKEKLMNICNELGIFWTENQDVMRDWIDYQYEKAEIKAEIKDG